MSELRVVTWNLNGLDPEGLDERSEAACLALLLRDPPAHLILLQEVVRRSWHAHLKHHFAAAGYQPIPEDPPASTQSEYFCVLFVRRTLPVARSGAEPFPNSQMGRQLVWAELALPDTTLLCATSHLESTPGARAARIAQLKVVCRGLLDHDGPALFGGDTNLRKAEEASVPDLAHVTDAWTAAGAPAELRATWPVVPRSRRPGARFDRLLVHDLEVTGFQRFGASAPGSAHPPSDHYAIEATLR